MLIIHSGGRRVIVQTHASRACPCATLVQPYVGQTLAAGQVPDFEMHLMDCPACRSLVEVARLLKSANQERDKYCGQLRAIPVRRKR